MKYQAIWNNTIIAEAKNEEILKIEGNIYFPNSAVRKEFLDASQTHTTCPWKGLASYYTLVVDGVENPDAAWFYANPKEGSEKLVAEWNQGRGDFQNYIAFWKGVDIKEI